VSKFQTVLDLKFQNKSFFIFSNKFPPRRWAILITENVWFERFILCVIITNCIFLSLYDPLKENDIRNRILEVSEIVFQVLFTLEMMLNIFARGLILHKHAYLRDYWSGLDALIVVTGFLGFLQLGNLSILRAFRLLRPLRAISGLKEMRVIINAVARSLPMLMNALVLYFFFLLLYAIMAVQLFLGKMHNRCYHELTLELYDDDYYCGSQECPHEYVCLQRSPNPQYGFVSFDNIVWSILTLFTSITREDWVYRMYSLSETVPPIIANTFFISLVLIGSFFIVNLNLVIISESFDRQLRLQKEKHLYEKKRLLEEQLREDEPEYPSLAEMTVSVKEPTVRTQDVSGSFPKSPMLAVNDEPLEASESAFPERQNMYVLQEGSVIPGTTTPIHSHYNTKSFNGGPLPLPETSLSELLLAGKIRSFIFGFAFYLRSTFSLKEIIRQLDSLYETLAVFFDTVPYQKTLRRIVSKIMRSRLVVFFFTLLTILNTVALGIDYYMMPTQIDDVLVISNYIFIALFTMETVFKSYGMGLKAFLSDGFNAFDAVIVFMSLIELPLPISSGLTVLRTFRLLRIFKLARFSKSIQKLLRIVFNSVRGAFMLTILLALVIFIYALLGMQLFGGNFGPENNWENNEKPRFNYDTLDWALITTFVMVSAENWPTLLYQGMRAAGAWSFVYFVSLYIIGNALVLNLFIGLLLSQFENDEEVITDDQKTRKSFNLLDTILGVFCFWKTRRRKTKHSVDVKFIHAVTDYQLEQAVNRSMEEMERERKCIDEATDSFPPHVSTRGVTPSISLKRRKRQHRSLLMDRLLGDYSLFIFGRNWFRRLLNRIVEHRIVELFILFLILLSAVALVLEDPFMPPNTPMMQFVSNLNLALTILFTIECVLKIVAKGFIFMHGAYLRSIWNVLDFIIVIVGILGRVSTSSSLETFRALRLLRTLRPLRFVNRLESLKVVVDALIMSIPAIINVLLFSAMNYIIFGIMGVNLFAGSFYQCSNPKWSNRMLCEADGHKWSNISPFNFDNLFNAMLTLFFMGTMEGYPTMLLLGVDATEPEWAPVRDNRTYMSLYFIAYIIVGSFFMTNLFVGVLIDNYYTLKTNKKIGLLSEKQKDWINMQRVLLDAKPEFKPKPPSMKRYGRFSSDKKHFKVRVLRKYSFKVSAQAAKLFLKPAIIFRRILFRVATSSIFELLITTCILLNMVSLSMEHYGSSDNFTLVLTILNYIWTTIFLVEAAVKLIAFGVIQYFRDLWNCFDFLICVVSIAGVAVSLLTSATSGFTSIFRLLRVGRLFRLLRVAQGLRQLLKTLFLSIPSLFNVSCLLLLLFFIYAVLGSKLFAKIRWTDGYGISSQSNFRYFHQAMILLFRSATGEDFQNILSDTMMQPPLCSHKFGDCGEPILAVAYFCSFILIAMFVLMNLFVAVILENFSSVINSAEARINEHTVSNFLKCWRRYDPHLTLYIDANNLTSLVLDVGEPLGFNSLDPGYNRHMRNLMRSLADINHHPGNMLHYQEVLMRLARYKFGAELPVVLSSKFDTKWHRAIPRAKVSPEYTVQQIYAAMKVQQYWRKKLMMRRLAQHSSMREVNQFALDENFESDSAFSNLESFNDNDYDPDIFHDDSDLQTDDVSIFSDEELQDIALDAMIPRAHGEDSKEEKNSV